MASIEQEYYYYELLARLHLLLVKNKIRKVYYDVTSLEKPEYFEAASDVDSVITDHLGNESKTKLDPLDYLKQVSAEMNLRIHEEKYSYFYLYYNNAVPNNILVRFCRNHGYGRHVWIFDDPNVKNTIDDVAKGNVRIGDLLEYPKCCVDWLAKTQTESLIDCYDQWMKVPLSPWPDDKIVELLLDYFESDDIPNNKKRRLDITNNHVDKTISKYPFVFHHACIPCLKNSTSPTARLNQRYGEFARHISQEFYEKLIDESKKQIR